MKRFLAFTITIKEDDQGNPVLPASEFHKLLESVGFYDFKSPYLNEGSDAKINGVYEYEPECLTIGFNVFWFEKVPKELFQLSDKFIYHSGQTGLWNSEPDPDTGFYHPITKRNYDQVDWDKMTDIPPKQPEENF